MKLTANDRRALWGISHVSEHYDGYTPHGAADWTAIRRLESLGLATFLDVGVCRDCGTVGHEWAEVPIYVLTPAGQEALRETGGES